MLARLRGPAPKTPCVLIPATFPDDAVSRLGPKRLPDDWRAYPRPAALQTLGDACIAKQASLVLPVPSAIIPEEPNFLIDPRHPDVASLTIGAADPFRFGRIDNALPFHRPLAA